MRSSGENLLLVEGESDRSFFEQVFTLLNLRASIHVAPPRDVGGRFNTKEGLLNHLPILLAQLADGRLKRLSVVLDADFVANSALGFSRTCGRIETQLNEHGFELVKSAPQHHGLVFRHTDGLADLGVWIMPNNRDDGSLEDLLHACVNPNELALFQHAQKAVKTVTSPKFRPTHITKAELATWLAWQQHPGRGVHHALQEGLFDVACPSFVGLTDWLRRIFS